MGILDSQAVATRALQVTQTLWRQPFSDKAEPIHIAWRRIFGEPLGFPVLLAMVPFEGRDHVVRLYAKGRVTVLDPINGTHQIRILPRKQVEGMANAARADQARLRPAVERWLRP